jgi:hypothetical protein
LLSSLGQGHVSVKGMDEVVAQAEIAEVPSAFDQSVALLDAR